MCYTCDSVNKRLYNQPFNCTTVLHTNTPNGKWLHSNVIKILIIKRGTTAYA